MAVNETVLEEMEAADKSWKEPMGHWAKYIIERGCRVWLAIGWRAASKRLAHVCFEKKPGNICDAPGSVTADGSRSSGAVAVAVPKCSTPPRMAQPHLVLARSYVHPCAAGTWPSERLALGENEYEPRRPRLHTPVEGK